MYAQQYNIQAISIIILIFFLTLISRNHGHEDYATNRQVCNYGNSVPCGTLNPGYPFWGRNIRPRYCSVEEFELSCKDSKLFTHFGLGSKYHVLDIKPDTNTLTLVHSGDIVHDICAINITINNTIFNDKVFGYGDDTEDFHFFYNCPPEIYNTYVAKKFTCPVGDTNRKVIFGHEVFLDGQGAKRHLCENITVPVRKILPEICQEDVVKKLQKLFQKGFEVHYYIDKRVCSDCNITDGLCWRNTNLPINNTCHHGNGVQSPYADTNAGRKNMHLALILSAVAVALGGSMLLLLLVFFIYYHRKRAKDGSSAVSRNVSPYSFSMSDSEKGGGNKRGVMIFSYSELEKATNNFDSNNELGDGGFGTVYKGKLQDGREVAVKRLYENNFKRVEQFMNEIAILEPLRHPNLVLLYGSTSPECRKLLLVYEYIPNGTIADHLYGEDAKPGNLSWKTRMSIAVETASALSYLHVKEVIHRDVKTTNILLDNNFRAKVADFGLSRLFPMNVTHVSTSPQGTPGYVDPEYRQCYHLTNKSDVYSFGVVLIELISSLPAVDISRHRDEINLSNMAINKIQGDALHELIDPTLRFGSDYKVRNMITEVAELAFMCLQNEREMRPSMEEVHKVLTEIWIKYYGGENKPEVDLADEAFC